LPIGRLFKLVGGLAILLLVLYVLLLVALLFLGFIGPILFLVLLVLGVPFIVALAILSIPVAFLALAIPLAILLVVLIIVSILLSVILSAVLTLIVLWVANTASTEVIGVALLPLREDGSVVWWRVILAVLLFLSIYALISRIFQVSRVETRREAGLRYA
jgi:hypothetical protein